jgi:hypothetical protein
VPYNYQLKDIVSDEPACVIKVTFLLPTTLVDNVTPAEGVIVMDIEYLKMINPDPPLPPIT